LTTVAAAAHVFYALPSFGRTLVVQIDNLSILNSDANIVRRDSSDFAFMAIESDSNTLEFIDVPSEAIEQLRLFVPNLSAKLIHGPENCDSKFVLHRDSPYKILHRGIVDASITVPHVHLRSDQIRSVSCV
jgi:hypothetical protein